MAFGRSTEHSMKAEDKSSGLLPYPLDNSFNDLFNQYVNMDRPNADENKEKLPCPNGDTLFVQGTPSSVPGYVPVTCPSIGNNQPAQPWRKGLWCLQEAASSTTDNNVRDKTVRPSAVGGNFEINASPQPHQQSGALISSATSTTSNKQTPNSGTVAPRTVRRRQPQRGGSGLRKYNSTPTLLRTKNTGESEMTFQALRTPKSQNFAFQNPERWTSFPSPPAEPQMSYSGLPHLSTSCNNIPFDSDVRDSAEFPTARFQSDTPHSSQTGPMSLQPATVVGQHDQFDAASEGLIDHGHFNTEDLFHTTYTSDQSFLENLPFSSWESDLTNGTSTLPYEPERPPEETPSWWATIPARFSQPYSQPYEPMITAPAPRQIDTNVANSSNVVQGDFGAQLSSASDLFSSAEQFFPEQISSPTDGASGPYSFLPASQSFPLDYLVSNCSQKQPSSSPSHSPSVSPTLVTFPRPGPTTNTATSATSIRAQNSKDNRRSHNRKQSVSGSTPRTPRSTASFKGLGGKASNGALNVSFVNFTPDDSKKILTGVAPSGSSKTKARRELEAREKRRKLSEAALTAIRRAGGDFGDLQLFSPE